MQAKEHVNKPAKLVKTPAAATNAAGVNAAAAAVTTGRKLMATAPGPAPEEGPAARRDMPPLPPMMPGMTAGAMAPQPGAMPAQGGPLGGPQNNNVGVFQVCYPLSCSDNQQLMSVSAIRAEMTYLDTTFNCPSKVFRVRHRTQIVCLPIASFVGVHMWSMWMQAPV